MKYFSTKLQIEWHHYLVYIVNNLLGLLTSLIPICAFQFIWSALYESGQSLSVDYNLNEMKLYSLVAIGVSLIYGNSVIETLGLKVMNGNIVFDFIQPKSVYISVLIYDICRIIVSIFTHFIPVFLITIFMFSISLKSIQLVGAIKFIVLIFIGYLIMFSFCFLVSLLSAWITNIYNSRFMLDQVLRVISGAIVPLWMWPNDLKNIILHTPFPYIISAPIAFLIKNKYEYSFTQVIQNQLIWFGIILVVNIWLYRLFRKKLNIQGG